MGSVERKTAGAGGGRDTDQVPGGRLARYLRLPGGVRTVLQEHARDPAPGPQHAPQSHLRDRGNGTGRAQGGGYHQGRGRGDVCTTAGEVKEISWHLNVTSFELCLPRL